MFDDCPGKRLEFRLEGRTCGRRAARGRDENAGALSPVSATRCTASCSRPPKPQALVVLVFGSGQDSAVTFNYVQHLLPTYGIAVFVYDKRGTGRSTGRFTVDFSELADDAIAAVAQARKLLAMPNVPGRPDGRKPGRLDRAARGEPLAGRLRRRVLRARDQSAGGRSRGSARRAAREALRRQRDREGPRADVDHRPHHVVPLHRRPGRSAQVQGRARRREVAARGRRRLHRTAAALAGRAVHELRSALGFDAILDYDAQAALRRVRTPMLWIVAGKDTEAPPVPTLEFLRTLQAEPTQLDIAVFPNADHGIIEDDRQSAGYHDLLAAWIRTRKLEGKFGTAILQPDASR